MNDKQTPQSKPTNSQSTKPIEDSFNASSSAKLNTPNKPGIRPNLMSGQVEATPIISENTFQQSSATGATPHSTLTAKPTAIPGQLKAKRFNSKLIGLGSVLGLLVLASIGLFITYNSYQKSYQKLQQSRVSNNISSTSVDLAGFNTTSTSADTTGLLQVNGDANITNNLTAGSFSGNGAGLTNVNAQTLNSQPGSFYQNASNINAGTLGDQFLSPNVALLDANQSFTGNNTFSGQVSLPGILIINSLTYNMPGSQAAGTLANDGTGNLIWQPAGACPTCVNTGGNSFGVAMSVGTNDNFNLTLRTNGITRLTFDTAGNATFTGTIAGNGSGITNLNGSNISSGTVADARLTSNVTLQGNLFNGAFELVQLGPAGQLPALNGAALTNLDASNISAGTLNDLRLSANVTLQGNTFNVANKLVQLNGTGGLPALDGSLLTSLNASNISSGTVADARLSANVALLNANQTFSGTNAFSAGITTNTIATTAGLTVGTTSQSLALQGNGSTTLASNSGGFVTTVGFSGAPAGNVNYNFDAATAAGTYGICTTVGNCASSGGGVTTLGGTTNKVAKFTGLQSIGDGSITDIDTQVTIQTTGVLDNTSAFRVLNADGTTTAFNVDTTNTRIGIGTATPGYAVDAVGDINSSTGLWVGNNLVCINTGCIAAASSGFYINNGTGTQATANFNIQSAAAGNIGGVIMGAAAQTASLQEWKNSAGTTLASVSAAGTINTAGQYQVAGVQIASNDLSNNANLAKLDATQSFTDINTFQNTTDSASAFRIQNAAGSSNLLIADTTNTRIGIGTASPGFTLDVNGNVNISTGSLYLINGVAICGATGTCAPSAGSNYYIQNTTTQQAAANFNIVSTAIGSITGILQGAVGQTAELLQLRAGDGTIVAGFSSVGVLTLGNDNGTPQAGSIVIHDNTDLLDYTSTIGTAALSAFRTITFPNETGTVCTTGSVCSGYTPGTGGAYANQQLSNLSGPTAINAALLPGTNSIDLGGSSAAFRDLYLGGSTTNYIKFSGTASAARTITLSDNSGTMALLSPTAQQTGALNISGTITSGLINGQTISSAANFTGTATVAGASLTLGTASTTAGSIVFNNLSNAFTTTLVSSTTTASNKIITFPNETGTVCTTAASSVCNSHATGYFQNGGNSFGTTATLGTNDPQALAFETDGTTRFTVASGATTLTGTGPTTLTSSGALTLTSALAATWSTSAGALTLDSFAALNLGTSAATSVSLGRTGITTTNNGALTVTQLLTGNLGATIGGGAIALTGTGNSSFTTSSGALTLTSAAAATWSIAPAVTGAGGALTIKAGNAAPSEAANGGDLTLQGGGSTGAANGGAVYISGGNILSNLLVAGSVFITGGTAVAGALPGLITINAGRVGETGAVGAITMKANSAIEGNGLVVNANAITTGKVVRILSTSTGITTGTGSLLDVQSTVANTAFTGSLANLLFTGNAAGNTGALLNIASTGPLSPTQLILATSASAAAPANGLVRFNFTGVHTNNGFQIDDATTGGTAMMINANSAAGGSALVVNSTAAVRTATAFNIVASGSNSDSISIQDSGNTCTGNPGATFAWTCSSDQSLKTNIADSQNILVGLSSLQIRAFDWLGDGSHESYGVVAQEVEGTQLSWLVKTDPVTGLKSVRTPDSYMLIKAIQELNTKVDAAAAGLTVSVLQTLADAEAITINGTLTINGSLAVNGKTSLAGDVTFNSDTAGTAPITAGNTSVHIAYTKTLETPPLVNITPKDFVTGGYKITNETTTGFDIELEQVQPGTVVFNWEATSAQ